MELAMTKVDFASALLPELVLYIVRECCYSANNDFRAYVRRLSELSSVCRHWRSAILTTSSFWTSVVASDELQFPSNELSLLLKRAFNARAQVDMSISLEKGRKADRQNLVEALVIYHAFFRHLKLSWTLPPAPNDITLRFPAIRSLHLDLAGSHRVLLDLSHSRHLESLEILSPLRLHVGGTHFHHLSSVTLIGNGYREAEDDEAATVENVVATIYDLLRSSPHLRSIQISQFRSRITEKIDIEPLETLNLLDIQSLTLTDLQPELISTLLHSFRCPSLKSLHVAPYGNMPPLEHLADFVARSRDSLETLKVHNVDGGELRRSIKRSSSIRKLVIDGQRYSPESVRSIVAELTGHTHRGTSFAVCPKLRSLELTGCDFSLGHAEIETLLYLHSLTATWITEKDPFHLTLRQCLLGHKLESEFLSLEDCCDL